MDNRDWIVLDTETTGLSTDQHRIIEIGAIRIKNRIVTKEHFHYYLQPDRLVDPQAMAVHGITDAFLKGKPRFKDVAQDFLEWIKGGVLVIHNASFDIGFLNMELGREGLGPIDTYIVDVIDTLAMARSKHRGKKNDLNTLLTRYGVDSSERTLHGALLDARLLADLYLRMTQCQERIEYDSYNKQSEKLHVNFTSLDAQTCAVDTSWLDAVTD